MSSPNTSLIIESPSAVGPAARGRDAAWTLAFAVGLAALTLVRILVLFVSPLELYPDEAQYWLWSRHLAFGYFSKPPMIAWLIRATTTLGGQGEAWVRLSAPLSHGLAAIGFTFAGRRLYDLKTGLLGATIYTLCPGVQLSSAVIATDAPLMVWLALALWAYAVWWRAEDRRQALAAAAGFGLALGFAFLTKYAALYFVGAAVLHALVSRETRRRWRIADLALAIGLFLLMAAPNAIWNATHHFQTLTHTAANANLGDEGERHGLFDLRGGPGYVVGQFGVFGPLAFTVFVGGAILAWRAKRLETADILLLLFAAPPLLIVLVEAVVSRANANWAGAAYGPAAILAAAFLLRWRARRMAAATLISQALMAVVFLTVFAKPALADRVGFANSFKRARGWAATAQMIETEVRGVGTPLSAIAVDDRFLFNALAYYGRRSDGTPGGGLGAPLRMWVREAVAHNQAEAAAPLDAETGRRVLVANATPHYRREIIADFQRVAPTLTLAKIRLDKTHDREIALFVAEGFHRQPRDPRTGRPFRP